MYKHFQKNYQSVLKRNSLYFSFFHLKCHLHALKKLPKKLPTVKQIAKISCQIVLFSSKNGKLTILFPYKLCVTEKRTYVKQIEIPYNLAVLLSIPNNKIPRFSAFDDIFLLISIGLGPGWQKVINFFLVSRSHLIFGEVSCNKTKCIEYLSFTVCTYILEGLNTKDKQCQSDKG